MKKFTKKYKLSRLDIVHLVEGLPIVEMNELRTTVGGMLYLAIHRLLVRLNKKLLTESKNFNFEIHYEELMALSYWGGIVDRTPVLLDLDPELAPATHVVSSILLTIPAELIPLLGAKNSAIHFAKEAVTKKLGIWKGVKEKQ